MWLISVCEAVIEIFFIVFLVLLSGLEIIIFRNIDRIYSINGIYGDPAFNSKALVTNIGLFVLILFLIFSVIYSAAYRRLMAHINTYRRDAESTGTSGIFSYRRGADGTGTSGVFSYRRDADGTGISGVSPDRRLHKKRFPLLLFNISIIILFFLSLELPFRTLDLSFAKMPESDAWFFEDAARREIEKEKPPDIFRIIVMGDSALFGVMSREKLRPASQLENLLNERLPGITFETLNAAKAGSNSWNGLRKLETGILEYKPDLVIVGYNNDGSHSPFSESLQMKETLPARLWIFLWDNSRFFRITAEAESRFLRKNPLTPVVTVKDSREHYIRMAEIIRASGGEMILVSMPELLLYPGETFMQLNPEYREALHRAVSEKDIPLIDFKQLWAAPAPSNFWNDRYHLTEEGCIRLANDISEYLVNSGILWGDLPKSPIEKKGGGSLPPLFEAVKRGDIEKAKSLLSGGANADERGDGGWTPLHQAAFDGNASLAALLLNKGADVNARDNGGMTPLHEAAWMGHLKTAELLISRGADLSAVDENGWTPLHNAVWAEDKDLKKTREMINLLISKGAKINAADEIGCTPLHIAVIFGHVKLAEYLLDKGADVNAADRLGDTPLLSMPRYSFGHPPGSKEVREMAELLLSRGAEVNIKNNEGRTSLHEAAIYNAAALAEILIAGGAKINAREDYSGRTPVHEAVLHNCRDMVELLISRGANLNARDKEGRTPLHYAELHKNRDMIELLECD